MRKGVSKREIARVLKVSRWTVREVLRSNSCGGAAAVTRGDLRAVPAADPGTVAAAARATWCGCRKSWRRRERRCRTRR